MVGNILKVIAALCIGYLFGWVCGGALGILLGLIPALFLREIAAAGQSTLMSILLAVLLGGLLGLIEVMLFNRLFDTHDRLRMGLALGALAGLLVLFFWYFALDLLEIETWVQQQFTVALVYSGTLGSRIGAVVFSILGALGTLREILRPLQAIRPLRQ